MRQHIRFFGGRAPGHRSIEDEDARTWAVERDFGFDRDIDGKWLVWAMRLDPDAPRDDNAPAATGSIVVRDPHAIAFLDMLAELIAYPDRFRHEPSFDCDETSTSLD